VSGLVLVTGAKVAAGDPREIADVEPGAGNNRAAGTATASGFLNSDAPLEGSGRRGGQRPPNGLPVQADCCPASRGTARVFFREVLAGHDARHASPLARHNRAICTQATEPAIKPTQVNIRSAHVQHRKRITVSERSRSLPIARSPADRRVFVGQPADARFPAEWGMICVRQDAERPGCRPWVAGSGVFRRAAAVDGTGGRVLG